ncbi:winged helix-turn-helix transcriptional regulator [Chitinophaga pinensis]|uniref:Transcriptional regulator, HxlR family n=1 Tax=Chitinophaga pinensis (strain ATCC 43595 / DSM 2588 / LMG 13176 / NBRC 15968 / NCIMB 11800 / UQM 2034) TaxID=485918 RepID=A0A979G2C4_CHIPD|nr:helix-turn-helix domain-containing protein [Chitinophaga pinensis]ACU59560.1 transcriptional regulator, HxlR family [Chitinophaga pinensis DSM 2588]
MKKIEPRSGCPISFTLDFLGDKWTLLILRDMVVGGKSSYGDFLSSNEKIATNVLADKLNKLEEYGFVTKKVSAEKKNKFLFTLTKKAIDLVPIIMEMTIWGSTYNPPGNPELLKALTEDKEGTIRQYQQKLVQVLDAGAKV